MQKEKICYLDVETTGLEAGPKDIWQLACIIEIDGLEVDRLNLKMRPYSMDGVKETDYALKMNKLTIEYLNSLDNSRMQFDKFKTFLSRYVDPFNPNDKFLLAGYNVNFDARFVQDWFKKHNDIYFGNWFGYHFLDVMAVVINHFRRQATRPKNNKLETVGRFLGLVGENANLHDAMYDIELTRDIDHRLNEKTKSPPAF